MLTVLIPTKNRAPFLTRLCSYYHGLSLKHKLLIVDSSDPSQASANRRSLDLLGSELNVEYRLYENDIGFLEKVNQALALVDTPYSVLGADDDMFVPSALTRAVEFLEANSEYVLAHGDALTFSLNTTAASGKLENVWRYQQRTIDNPTGAERLVNHLVDYSPTWYSVHRTEQLRENLAAATKMVDLLFVELLPSTLSVIQGKARKLDGLYMARQNDTAKDYDTFDPFEWITSSNWADQYECFRDQLAEALAHQDKIEVEGARAKIKQAFWSYLGKHMALTWQSSYGAHNASTQSLWKRAARSVPGARRVRQALRRSKRKRAM